MDFTSAPHSDPEKPTGKDCEPLEVKDFNFKKSRSFTSRSKEVELQEVNDFNPIELENKELENNELSPYQPSGDWEERGVDGIVNEVRGQIEYDVLREEYGKEVSDEVVEIITEVRCRDSPDMQIGRVPISSTVRTVPRVLSSTRCISSPRYSKVKLCLTFSMIRVPLGYSAL